MRYLPFLYLVLALSACSSLGQKGPYLVYFPERSAHLDPQARSLVALVAQRANELPAAAVNVVGYTDSAGNPLADVALARQRAQTVADALAADGVSANRLVRAGRGQTRDDPGIASRRVEISIGGG